MSTHDQPSGTAVPAPIALNTEDELADVCQRLVAQSIEQRVELERLKNPGQHDPLRVYLASPYSSPNALVRSARFEAVCRAAGVMIADGIHVFAPIVYSHSVALFRGLPIDFEFWRTFDRSMIGWSDEVHVLKLDGWEESRGIGEELIIAAELGKPVRYIVSADHNAVEIY